MFDSKEPKKIPDKPYDDKSSDSSQKKSLPSISLPKGGGAIHGIGEKFSVSPVTGTGSVSVPIYTSPGRSGFGPLLSLGYDSGAGNGPFGLGWNLSIPSITRKTDNGLPKYQDEKESDVFILSGAEDLVPILVLADGILQRKPIPRKIGGVDYNVQRYRPRIEGLFARIERWTNITSGEMHWRSISKDNITTLYGKTAESRIEDPENPLHAFSWMICESYDDKGNAMRYVYKDENSQNIDLSVVSEKNRNDKTRSSNKYLKRIKYGNKTPRQPGEDLTTHDDTDWMFEVVFDYGEHYLEDVKGQPVFVSVIDDNITHRWQIRQDPFSNFRAGFEIRTYRLCRRVLMFHHFADNLGTPDYLVRSTEFIYDPNPVASFITSIIQSGYVLNADGKTYLKKSMPPLEFGYTKATINKEIKEIDPISLENIPYGLDGTRYKWIDLDSEGLSGILTEQGGAWFYKHNLSGLPVNGADGKPSTTDARFEAQEIVASFPSSHDLNNNASRQHLTDLTGDGQVDLVLFDRFQTGYFKRNPEQIWDPFVPFSSIPNINWDDPNLKFVDLTGDGHPDILITEDQVFTWYPSLAEKGFGNYEQVRQTLDEEDGPNLVFADGNQSIYLADMSGDGLTDLVRIQNGEICYWPNLGFGKFGAKVTMDNSPLFDFVDQFDNQRIRLVDTDGSGTTDIIYLGNNGVHLYLNQSGNSWESDEQSLVEFPTTDNLSSVTAVDLLGNGTACLVWSSPLSSDARHSMRYIDLMGGVKPHLLVSIKTNMGAETRMHYVPSTKFYLMDKYAGQPWITKLPFPVQVVERIETFDWVSRNYFVTRYAYHHGYFDGIEREFRGFGLIEQFDTEEFAALNDSETFPTPANIEESSHIPPVLTKTWFHTGSYFRGGKISRHYGTEYYQDPEQQLLADTVLPTTITILPDTVLPVVLTPQEEREACRALKGSILRQEIYALDNLSDKIQNPYSVSERNYTIEFVQRQAINEHGIYFVHPREIIDYHYERDNADPRTSHALTLKVDPFGNVIRAVAIGYGRRNPDLTLTAEEKAKQTEPLITCTENTFTNYIDFDGDSITSDDSFRNPLPEGSKTYELTGPNPDTTTKRFDFNSLDKAITEAATVPYEAPHSAAIQKRLIAEVRTIYRKNNLSVPLPRGIIESLALPFETYKLAFTPGLVKQVYGSLVSETMFSNEGRYIHLDMDANWWIPSGKIFFSPTLSDTSTREFDFAKAHFFLPHRFEDPFLYSSTIKYDKYSLLIEETHDPLDNIVTVMTKDDLNNNLIALDYRVLQPWIITDPNGNRTAVSFDILGLVALTSVMGKIKETDGIQKGDTLPTDLEVNLNDDQTKKFFDDPYGMAPTLLGSVTSRIIYNINSFYRSADPLRPVCAATIMRETHVSDLQDGISSKIQVTFSYFDGFGREVQKKIPAEPEKRPGTLRWVGSGWMVFNNKGKPVKKYEPFFSNTHQYEYARKIGISPTLSYDPLGRLVATLHPNYTYKKVAFDPWRQENWDVNDTVLQTDPKKDPEVGAFFSRLPDSDYLPTWYERRKDGKDGLEEQKAAVKTAAHAGTPTVAYFDTLGRTFLTIVDAGGMDKYRTRIELDIEGNQRVVIDALGRKVMVYDYDMVGNRIKLSSMDAGERWNLNNVLGKPISIWDSLDRTISTKYDMLQRATRILVHEDAGTEKLTEEIIYGESEGDARNLRGRVFQHKDGSGIVTNACYDFKGNLIKSSRQLITNYKSTVNWNDHQDNDGIPFITITEFDALNRQTKQTTPDGSVIRFFYNEAGLLEQVKGNLHAEESERCFVKDIDYNEKGQRKYIEYGMEDGNRVWTTYEYNEKTFRLGNMHTARRRKGRTDEEFLQDLYYIYDPAGNIMHIQDNAQKEIFVKGRWVEPSSDYVYDAVYRLKEASGREHLGTGSPNPPEPMSPTDEPRVGRMLNDPNFLGTYKEQYVYDPIGNIEEIEHLGTDPSNPGWTLTYNYNENSLIETGEKSNHLSSTLVRGITYSYRYDVHGNMTYMPHFDHGDPSRPNMHWDFKDQLHQVDLDTDGAAYYVYDASGQRVRKVHEHSGALIEERLYFGNFEVYRKRSGTGLLLVLERETLHITDDQQRIAMVETRTIELHNADRSPQQLIRFQFGNHLDSATLEIDERAQIISYEEYYPYGSTSYHALRNRTEAHKRYRYTGKERDEESGLYYYGARYYASWLGKWISCDPGGIIDGLNMYEYTRNNPVCLTDLSGKQSQTPNLSPEMQAAWENAERANYDDASVKRLLDTYEAERIKGGQAILVKNTALNYATIRASAAGRNWDQGRYFRGTYHGVLALAESIDYAIFGDTPEDTAKKTAILLGTSAGIGVLRGIGGAPVKGTLKPDRYPPPPAPTTAPTAAPTAAPPPPPPPAPTTAPTPPPPAPVKPTIEAEPSLGRFKAFWGKDPKAFSIFEPEGGGVRVSDIFRGGQPKGSGGRMLADALRGAQIPKPKFIRLTNILADQPTVDQLAKGMTVSETVLGRTLSSTVESLGGKITNWASGIEKGKPWIEAQISY
jgi:RHS repeat-associated protein